MQSTNEQVELLQALMGDGELDAEVARRVLLKYKGDIQAAASALLEGDKGEALITSPAALTWPANFENVANGADSLNNLRPGTPVPPELLQPSSFQRVESSGKDVIDLTVDELDPELSQALQLSLQDDTQEASTSNRTVFTKSDRAPDPNWAVVPSNVATSNAVSTEDQSLSQAIEASLSARITEDKYVEFEPEQRFRPDRRPVALRTKDISFCYASYVLQALFFVPQIRHRLATWRPRGLNPGEELSFIPPSGSPDAFAWQLLSLFTYMDYAILSYISIDDFLQCGDYRAASPRDIPGELAEGIYSNVAFRLESALKEQAEANASEWTRLFHLRHGYLSNPPNNQPLDPRSDMSCVRIETYGTEETNDLVSCLSSQLGLSGSTDPSNQLALFEPSDVVAFHLVRHQVQGPKTQSSGVDLGPFKYPRHVYLDQFLAGNSPLVNTKRQELRDKQKELSDLREKKERLTKVEGKDTLTSLKATLDYYENHRKDTEKSDIVESDIATFKRIIPLLEQEIKSVNTQIGALRKQIDNIFEDSALQNHRYDLRSVLVHDGFFGRNHSYSYVEQDGVWWKTLDHQVTQVSEETVLKDSTGLHLGAGPFMLLYSKAVDKNPSEREEWPSLYKDVCIDECFAFIEGLNPEFIPKARAALEIIMGKKIIELRPEAKDSESAPMDIS